MSQQIGTDPQESLGSLLHRLSQQIPELVRSEMRLAQAELTAKGKRAGQGAGMFGAAGVLAFLGAGALVACAILALALVLPGWASALIVAAVLLIAAGAVAMLAKKRVEAATPAKPEHAIDGIREDIAVVKGVHS